MNGASITFRSDRSVGLTLNAARNIALNGAQINAFGSALDLTLSAAGSRSGAIKIEGSTISTNGGQVRLGGSGLAAGPRPLDPTLGAVGDLGSVVTGGPDGVLIGNASSIDAGAGGSITITGSTALTSLAGGSGVNITSGSRLTAQDISITGWANSSGRQSGVRIFGSSLNATRTLSVTGSVFYDGTADLDQNDFSGLRINDSKLSVAPETEVSAPSLTLTGEATIGGPRTRSVAYSGLYLQQGDGSVVSASGGASMLLEGSMQSGSAADYSATIMGRLQAEQTTVIDAGSASSLVIRGTGEQPHPVSISGTDIAAPSFGRLDVSSNGSLLIGQATAPSFVANSSIHGPASSATFVAAGSLSMPSTTLDFTDSESRAPLTVQAGTNLTLDGTRLATDGSIQLLGKSVSLGEGTLVSTSAEGDSIVVAGPGGVSASSFANSAAGVFRAGEGGRWLVYAETPATVTAGDLPTTFRQYDAPFGTTPASGGNGFLFTLAPTLTFGGVPTKVYDGNTSIVLTDANLQPFGGVQPGDSVFVPPETVGTFADANAATGKAIAIDPATFVFGNGLDTAVYGYRIAPLTGTISRKPLQFTAPVAANKVYDGNRAAAITGYAVTGLVGTETLGITATGTFETKDVGNGKVVTPNFALSDGTAGGLAGNYEVAPAAVTTTADITPRTLSVIGGAAANKVYDGTVVATVTPGILSNLVGDETFTLLADGSFDTKDAGLNRDVAIRYRLGAGSNGGVAGNYAFTGATAFTVADITPRPLSLDFRAANKTYDGNRDASVILPGTIGNLVAGEGLTVVPTGTFDTKDAGLGKTVTISYGIGDVSPGTLGSNYSLPITTTTADITRRALLPNYTAADKTYDGNRNATITGSSSGVIAGESLPLVATGTFDTKDAGVGKTVTIDYAAGTPGPTTLADNYTIPASTTTTANIDPKLLTASFRAANKIYDGNRIAEVLPGATGGLIEGESLSLIGSGLFDTKDAGIGKTVTIDYAAGTAGPGTLAGNYRLPAATTTTADVTPKPLIPDVRALDKVYDGDRIAQIVSGPTDGAVAGESLPVTASGLFDTKDAGIGKTVFVSFGYGTPGPGTNIDNYALPAATTTTATITPKPLSVSGFQPSNKVYDGSRDAAIGPGTIGGMVGTEAFAAPIASGLFDTKDAALNKPVTVHVDFGPGSNGALPGNYSLADFTRTADITPRPLTAVGGIAADKVYDGNTIASVNAGAFANLVGSENFVPVVTGAFDTRDVGIGKTVTINYGLGTPTDGALSSNYELVGRTTTTTADINTRGLALALASVANKRYDGSSDATVTAWRLAGVLPGDEVAVGAGTASFVDPNVDSVKPVAVTATATALSGVDSRNYVLTQPKTTTSATIDPASLRYVANPATAVAGGQLPPLSGAVTGFVAEETLATATTGTLQFTTAADRQTPAGRYAIDGSGLTARNYVFSQDPANATALTLVLPTVEPKQNVDATVVKVTQPPALPVAESSPVVGRTLDIVQALEPDSTGKGPAFRSVAVADMSRDALAALLAARDQYKKDLFATAIAKLEADPTIADAQACLTLEQVKTGECLITAPQQQTVLASRGEESNVAAATAPAASPSGTPATVAAASPPAAPLTGEAITALVESQPTAAFTVREFPSRRAVHTAALPQIERKLALLIGLDKYSDARIPQLDNAVADARAVARMLETSLGYETVLIENGSKQAIVRAMNQLATEAGPRDSVVIYYAGHGEVVPATGLGYWQPSNADPDKPETWISNADIGKLIGQLSASQVALISDSCYSGSLVASDQRIRPSNSIDPQQVLSRKSVVVMSSGGNEPVFDAGKEGHSSFAFNLMRNLQQVSSWQAGGNVFERVRFAVAKELPQRPQYGASAGHQAGGDYLFEQRQLDAPR